MWKFLSSIKSSIGLLLIPLLLVGLDSNLQEAKAVSNTILINEVLYDPAGSDSGYEWIELYNNSDQEIDLADWTLSVAGTTFKLAATLSGVASAQDFFLICEEEVPDCDLHVTKLGFQNGGGATDGIQLMDAQGSVIDALFYDSPNSNTLTNEVGEIVEDEKTAPVAGSSESLGRRTYVDTDNYGNDFIAYSTPTPKLANFTEEKKEELDPAGSSPKVYISLFLFFILLRYSARLLKHYNFMKNSNGKS